MPIDVDQVLGAQLPPVEVSWNERDILLYHLSLGAGVPATDASELVYAYEDGLRVLPTFAVVAGMDWEPSGESGLLSIPGLDIDLRAVLHGEQEIEVHRPLPARGQGRSVTRIADVWDKGRAAVLRTEARVEDADGQPLWTARSSIFVRGEGGFGGDRGAAGVSATPPDRAPDHEVRAPVMEQQALLYRLNGDRNPLHADPAFAAQAGFDRPILHGLCTYGMTAKAVADACLDGRPDAISAYAARFKGIVLPGETLLVRLWADGDDEWIAQVVTEERGEPALEGRLTTGSR